LTVTFVSGCFDLIHPGHIALLEFAASFGAKTFVAVDSDTRVRQTKGLARPIQEEQARVQVIEAIKFVSAAKLFSTDEELRALIAELQPDRLVLGSDWRGKRIIGSEIVREVVFLNRVDDHSTSKLVDRVLGRPQA